MSFPVEHLRYTSLRLFCTPRKISPYQPPQDLEQSPCASNTLARTTRKVTGCLLRSLEVGSSEVDFVTRKGQHL
jgi:hypothetical protein